MRSRKLASAVALMIVGLSLVAVAHAQAAPTPASLAGIWIVRREVQVAQNCASGVQPGNVLSGLWTMDTTAGGNRLRVSWVGYSEFASPTITSTIVGSQIQISTRFGEHSSTIFLSKTGDHAMSGNETIVSGICTQTRSVVATRLH